MRKVIIATAIASTFLATAANARDGRPYVGLDLGLLQPETLALRFTDANIQLRDGLQINHKIGVDGDVVAGYDFGMF